MLFPPKSQQDRLNELIEELADKQVSALTAAPQFLAVDPEYAPALWILGNAAIASGDLAEAERLLWKSLELHPLWPRPYLSLGFLYHGDPLAGNADALFRVMGFWSAGMSEEVPPEFVQMYKSICDVQTDDIDVTDPETYCQFAQEDEDDHGKNTAPPELAKRIRPYWLLKDLLRGVHDGFSPEEWKQVQEEATVCVPLWRAIVRAWARDPNETNPEVLLLTIALLGEHAGPEVLDDLWELSNQRDNGIFLHAHWALCRMAERYPSESIESIRKAIPGASTGVRCGMAEHLGLMTQAEGVEQTILALVQDFAGFAKEDDAPYLLVAAADALSETGHVPRAKELFARNERLLTKEGRAWVRETLESPEGFVPRLVEEGLAEVSFEDVCLNRVLMDDEHDDEEGDEDEDLDDWDEEDDDFEEPVIEKPGRNDPCWCGSGKKYKKCHLTEDEEAERRSAEEPPEEDDPVHAEAMGGLLSTAERFHKRRDMMEAARTYFEDEVESEARMEEGSEGFFLWYLFDFRAKSGGPTAVEEHIRKRGPALSPEVLEMLESWRDSRFGLFEVMGAPASGGLELKDVCTGDGVLVKLTGASHQLDIGEYVLARLEERGGRVAFSGDTIPVPRDVLPALTQFIDTEIKTTGQTPAQFVRANSHRMHRIIKEL